MNKEELELFNVAIMPLDADTHPGAVETDFTRDVDDEARNYIVTSLGQRKFAVELPRDEDHEATCIELFPCDEIDEGRWRPVSRVTFLDDGVNIADAKDKPDCIRKLERGLELSCRADDGSVMWLPLPGRGIADDGKVGRQYASWFLWIISEIPFGFGPPV